MKAGVEITEELGERRGRYERMHFFVPIQLQENYCVISRV